MSAADVRETYVPALDALTTAARALLALADVVDLQGMRTVAGNLEALAPILEPAAYRNGGGLNLASQVRFLDATIAYVHALKQLDHGDRQCRLGTEKIDDR